MTTDDANNTGASERGKAEAAVASKPNYRKTLNLPRTAFPMKANLVQNEPQSRKRWKEIGLYQRIREARAGARRFVFHDGPPYANGDIHLGHLLNKCLKDFVVRSRTMMGDDCPFTPGWDCHGLPIEHKVMSEAVKSGKADRLASLDEEQRRIAVRRDCQRYAEKYVGVQSEQLQSLLTLADYDDPYRTMAPQYEAEVLRVFADLVEQGLVRRRLKAVHWSIDNQTALAEAELEYEERTDPSVYVEFEAADKAAVEQAFGLAEGDLDRTPTLMIWTTTPWTLPANLLIAAHPRHTYALVELDGSITILAADLVEQVAKVAGAENARTIGTAPGSALAGLAYRHPFVDTEALRRTLAARDQGAKGAGASIHRIVEAEYVTLEDGTGLVHTAPGHGHDDYLTGVRENVPIYCPVREDGTFDETAPEWIQGQVVWQANEAIADRLAQSGHLHHRQDIVHSYPHDWRGKSPVIFRATEQWFVEVDQPTKREERSLRDLSLEATGNVSFVPAWGANRMRGMLESRPDWCLSRQRAWGLPIPAFRSVNGDVLLTAASVRAVAALIEQKGSSAWLESSARELLRDYDPKADPDAPAGLDLDELEKMHDIFDVWFESGSSWAAALRPRGQLRTDPPPIDLYLEGSDQHRGWFQASLLCALGATGHAPYRTLLTHGFMVDKDGRKMSKSLGNTLDVQELLKRFGADVARWWVATLAYEHDVKADIAFFETAGEAYRKVRNTLRFMLGNLGDFQASTGGGEGMCAALDSIPPTSLDAWALAQFDRLSETVRGAYERYDFRAVSTALFDFCNDTLSAVYLAAVKDRLYCDKPDSARRRRTQTVLWDLADGLCRLLAPILPHTADEAHLALHGHDAEPTSVHLRTFIERFDAPIDREAFDAAMRARHESLGALERVRQSGGVENPLDAGLVLPDPTGSLGRFDPVDLADLCGVSRVRIEPDAGDVEVLDLRAEPRCERSWKRDETVKRRSDGSVLSDRDAEALGTEPGS